MKRVLQMTASVLALSAFSATAQNVDFTLGVEQAQGSLTYNTPTPTTYSTRYTALSFGGRATFDVGGGLFAGVDGSIALPTVQTVQSNLESIARGRVIVGYRTNGVTFYGAYGHAIAKGTFPSSSQMQGTTSALGLDFGLSDSANFQLEAFRENLADNATPYNSDWRNTGIRASAVVTF